MTNLNFEHHLGSLTHAALSQASIISRVWGEGRHHVMMNWQVTSDRRLPVLKKGL